MNKYDIVIVGYAVNQNSGGYSNNSYTFLDTVGAKYLYKNCFLDTYCAEPMAFMQLAAQLESTGLKVEVIDGLILGFTKQQVIDAIQEVDSDVFSFSIYESTKLDIYDIIHFLKVNRPEVKIVLGGPYATIACQAIMEENNEIDYIVVGDADFALPDLVKRIKNGEKIEDVCNLFYRREGKVCKTEAKCVEDLDSLHFPKRLYSDIILKRGYSFSISSSRGCGYASCNFCYLKAYQKIGGQPKYRFKSAKNVVNEIKDLVARYNIKKLSFCDEDFFGNEEGVERAISIFKLLIEENIKISLHVNARVKTVMWLARNGYLKLCSDAGVRYMYVGLESYNDSALKRYKKGITVSDIDYVTSELEKYNILINPGLITFDPLLTIDEVKRNVELYQRIYYYDAFMFTRRLVVYPNAPKEIAEISRDDGYFYHNSTNSLYLAMASYRDKVFPGYMNIEPSCITDEIKQKLINFHFECFYAVYDAIKYNKDSVEVIIRKYVDKTYKVITALTKA